jgi:threonyl-tRNA synthetase
MVVGAEEQKARAVNWRNRDDQATQQRGEIVPLDEAVKKLVALRDERRIENTV